MSDDRLMELLDQMDQQIRSLDTARALSQRQVPPELAAQTLTGLRHLLAGEHQQAAGIFEALVEELHERTVSLGQ